MAAAQEISPTVIITGDKIVATLMIPAGCDRAMFTEPLLIGLISGEGVEVTEHTTEVVRAFVQDMPAEDQEVSLEVAYATPAVHGSDGLVIWCVEDDQQGADEAKAEAEADAAEDDNVSHYERCTFDMIQIGDKIGRVHPAELGQDGRDVTGATIPAKSGKEAKLTIDESIMKQADGSLIAQQDGVLHREATKAQIRKQIHIHKYVDFSTGNIDFDGDITIDRGVRDCFEVIATGKVEVRGLIEAATIQTGTDLIAAGGFAGRERGHVRIGGSLRGKYLDNVHGQVKKDLCIDREVINCELAIDGKIVSLHGSIIGGILKPTGKIEIGTLGSAADVVTEVVIGSVPTLEPFARELSRITEQLTRDIDKLTEEQNIINSSSGKGRMTAADKERQTEIMFELSMSQSTFEKAQRTLDRVQDKINKRRTVDVTVHKIVYPGTTFILDERSYKITRELTGQHRFYMDGKRFVCRSGEATAQPVSTIAEVHAIMPGKAAA